MWYLRSSGFNYGVAQSFLTHDFLPANIKHQRMQSYLTQELLGLTAVQEGEGR